LVQFFGGQVTTSSDGKWLAFWLQMETMQTAGIYLFNLETEQLTRVTYNSEDANPEFLP
jgi:hypothetical protein